jgi:hypothetical protein
VQLSGGDRIEINTYGAGDVSLAGATFTAPKGLVNLHVGGNVGLAGAKLNAANVTVSSDGTMVDFRKAYVHAARDGYVFVSVAGSTVDCSGARWAVSEDNVVFDAENVIGYK